MAYLKVIAVDSQEKKLQEISPERLTRPQYEIKFQSWARKVSKHLPPNDGGLATKIRIPKIRLKPFCLNRILDPLQETESNFHLQRCMACKATGSSEEDG